jgi:hypothetical protein
MAETTMYVIMIAGIAYLVNAMIIIALKRMNP